MKSLDCILLVDDDSASNFLTERLLRKVNLANNIMVRSNGKEDLDYLTLAYNKEDDEFPRPDLILLDLKMPLVDGWEFLEAYQALPEELRESVVIIMLTTSLRDQDRERAESTGLVKGYINKPLSADVLLPILEELREENRI